LIFGSTPVQVISNIYRKVLHIELRANFIFKVRIFAQQFSKFTFPDRNNIVTGVPDFLQPRFNFLIHVLQSFLSLADGFCSIGHAKTPITIAPELLKGSIRLSAVPINIHIMETRQMKFHHITGLNENVTRPTNVCQPLKSLNSLAIPHTVIPSFNRTLYFLVRTNEEELLVKVCGSRKPCQKEQGLHQPWAKRWRSSVDWEPGGVSN
jgi:hypothetical protein